jgi:predicted metal-dependent hydrolase
MSEAQVLRVRRPRLVDDLPPRLWFDGDVVATHLGNAAGLLFPLGERFFVRSVRKFAGRVTDPGLAARIRGFAGQEALHAREHERFFLALTGHGLDPAPFLRVYERLAYRGIEAVTPDVVSLATTVALEHFTAVLAEEIFRADLLSRAHPWAAALLAWHAAEELEHRAVAFDVLQKVDPRYRTRVLGMVIATAGLAAFWGAATAYLLYQDHREGRPVRAHDLATLRKNPRSIGRDVFLRGLREYFERDFHPLKRDCMDLARRYLVDAGLEAA